MDCQIEEVAHHRNGVSGEPFYVITFRWTDDGDEPRPMVAILFEKSRHCAVLDREQTRQGNIAMAGGNSWRGDHFERAMRAAVARYEQAVERFDFATAEPNDWRDLGRRIFQLAHRD